MQPDLPTTPASLVEEIAAICEEYKFTATNAGYRKIIEALSRYESMSLRDERLRGISDEIDKCYIRHQIMAVQAGEIGTGKACDNIISACKQGVGATPIVISERLKR